MKINTILFIIQLGLLAPFLLFCTDDASESIVIPDQAKPQVKKSPKYHTPDNEGLWPGKSKTHIPKLQFIGAEKERIKVTVPLKPTYSPRHYIEVIVLMQGGRKQIAVKSFKLDLKEPEATFKLPDPSRNDYYVIVKCNLHDMWRTKVVRERE